MKLFPEIFQLMFLVEERQDTFRSEGNKINRFREVKIRSNLT